MPTIAELITDFAGKLTALVQTDVMNRTRSGLDAVLGMVPKRGPGRPAKRRDDVKAAEQKPRKKAPIQLCPVPRCTNAAAPIFGMVCAKHKDVAKSKVKKYREARRAKKAA